MQIKRRIRPTSDDSSASSDVAFLLIIYFMVIAGFNVNKGFIMNLPAKDSTRLIKKDDLLRFELDSQGSVTFQGSVIDRILAEQTIGEAAAANPNLAVILTIAPQAPWQEVVSFVELAQRLNIDSFSFTIAAEGEPSG